MRILGAPFQQTPACSPGFLLDLKVSFSGWRVAPLITFDFRVHAVFAECASRGCRNRRALPDLKFCESCGVNEQKDLKRAHFYVISKIAKMMLVCAMCVYVL